jgi:hypothetical protein
MRAQRLSVMAVGALALLGAVPLASASASATTSGIPTGTVGPISFQRGGDLVSEDSAGNDTTVAQVPSGDSGSTLQTWNPLGTRIDYLNGNHLVSIWPNGSKPTNLAGFTGGNGEATVSPDGSTAIIANGYVYAVPTDGSGNANSSNANGNRLFVPAPNGGPSGSTPYLHPRFLPDGSLLLTGTDNAFQHPSLYRYASGAVTLLVSDANYGTPSADGKRIAFVRADSGGVNQLFVVGADGSTGLTQLTHGTANVSEPSWSPDGKYLAYTDSTLHAVVEIDATSGTVIGSIANASSPAWTPPIVDSHVTREAGADRVGTAVAASQLNFANHGAADPARSQAKAVVLARSDNFADALGGSALAVRQDAPLLITPSAGLNSAVKTEIGRVLAPGGTVYLLGGTQALSPAVASALSGYHVVRLAGDTRYGTAVAIAKAITPHPSTVMIATGALFPDALAAGATGEPVLLTNGGTMPPETAAYLNTLNPNPAAAGGTELVTVGGPGDAALISAYHGGQLSHWPSQISRMKLAGPDRYTTALMVAQAYFTSNTDAALATGASWPDALSGGAMVGHRGGPLLLTAPTGISPAVLSYLGGQSASLYDLFLMGGPVALPTAIAQQAASAIGVPGHVRVDGVFAAAGDASAAGTGSGVGGGGTGITAKSGAAGQAAHGVGLTPVSR